MESKPNELAAGADGWENPTRKLIEQCLGNVMDGESYDAFTKGTKYPIAAVEALMSHFAHALRQAHERGARENSAKAWLEGYNAHTWEDDTGESAKNPYALNSPEPPRGEGDER